MLYHDSWGMIHEHIAICKLVIIMSSYFCFVVSCSDIILIDPTDEEEALVPDVVTMVTVDGRQVCMVYKPGEGRSKILLALFYSLREIDQGMVRNGLLRGILYFI